MDNKASSASGPRTFRKPNRIPGYNYSAPGYYFLTICTVGHVPLFGRIVACQDGSQPARMLLNSVGRTVEQAILAIPDHYPGTAVDKYVVMPNHIHLILVISDSLEKAPSVSRVVQQFKRAVSIHFGKSVWQEGFYDHVIRGDADYREIWTYIDNNPVKWARDKYYREG